jgi:hypothetical protein
MENNEKNNKKRAPESMEDLISQRFFRDDSEEPKPPLTEETDAAAEEPEAEATPVICDTVVEQGAAVDEAPPEDTAPLPDTDTTAKSAQEEADDVIEYDDPGLNMRFKLNPSYIPGDVSGSEFDASAENKDTSNENGEETK